MKKANRFLSAFLACAVLMSAAGCSSGTDPASSASSTSEGEPSSSSASSASSETENTDSQTTVTYPIDTDVTLTYWKELNSVNVAPNYNSLNDTEFVKYLEEETGVYVEFISPAVGNAQQAFNLLVASGNMPDIIEYGWNAGKYPGGPEAAIQNKIILPLNDLLETCAPDMKKLFDENPDYDKMVKTDAGTYYIFPVMKLDDYLNTTYGLVLRRDWLEDLGMEVPETIDEWHDVLTAFKEEKGAQFPFSYASPGNVFNPFANGKVKSY